MKIEKWSNTTDLKASLLNISAENLEKYILNRKTKFSEEEQQNLMDFFEISPKDIIFPVVKSLVSKRVSVFMEFLLNPLYEVKMINLIKNAKGMK